MYTMNHKEIDELVKNAKQLPKRYYGLHIVPGVAQYPGTNEKGEPRRLLVTENAIRAMEPTFECRPVFVDHQSVPIVDAEQEADGWVIRSFFNQADGKHWVEFIVTSDEGQEAIRKGFRLSNAYEPTQLGLGGEWNCVPYERELIDGKFNHLALVEHPRYDESVILTPEQFSAYNEKLLEDLKRVDNSKKPSNQPQTEEKSKVEKLLGFFKKTPAEVDPEMSIKLKSGKTATLDELVELANKADEMEKRAPEAKKDESEEGEAKGRPKEMGKEEEAKQGHREDRMDAAPQMANLDHHVHVNGASMSIRELMASHEKMRNCMNALSEHHASMLKQAADLDDGQERAEKDLDSMDKTARNAEDGGEKDAMKDMEKSDRTKRNDDQQQGPDLDPEKVAQFEKGFSGNSKETPEMLRFLDGMTGAAKKPDYFTQLKNAQEKGLGERQFIDPVSQGRSGVGLGKIRYGSK